MKRLLRKPLAEQTAAHLIEALRTGRWGNTLPGVNALAADFDVSRETVRAALRLLEANGSLLPGGPGRSRAVAIENPAAPSPKTLRVGILLHEPIMEENAQMQRTLMRLQYAIEQAGHSCFFSDECQTRMRHDIRRIARVVAESPADAWVVLGGSKASLEWFAAQPFSTIAFGGRSLGLPIASVGTDSTGALVQALDELTDRGHRRIVLISPHHWRKPVPGRIANVFNEALAKRGIVVSSYNLPDWEETPEGLQSLLHSLFRVTPPTAVLVVEPSHTVATLAFFCQRGLWAGRDVSLVCMMSDPAFSWRRPAISCFRGDTDPIVRHIVRWTESVARGCPGREQKLVPVEFDRGETLSHVRG